MPTDEHPVGPTQQDRDVLIRHLDELIDRDWVCEANTFEYVGDGPLWILVTVDDGIVSVHHRESEGEDLRVSHFIGYQLVEKAVAFTNRLRGSPS
ncbi:hypothetical protein QFZ21_000703 [Microbacterium sp. W4I20]|nr:hypothetical protein [Microbacterium sp. W4I20]